jgi:hypothetical protein
VDGLVEIDYRGLEGGGGMKESEKAVRQKRLTWGRDRRVEQGGGSRRVEGLRAELRATTYLLEHLCTNRRRMRQVMSFQRRHKAEDKGERKISDRP